MVVGNDSGSTHRDGSCEVAIYGGRNEWFRGHDFGDGEDRGRRPTAYPVGVDRHPGPGSGVAVVAAGTGADDQRDGWQWPDGKPARRFHTRNGLAVGWLAG